MTINLRSAQRILGMNARNLVFVRPYNPSRAVKLANNKLATKERLLAAGLPTAKLFGIIADRKALFEFDWDSLPTSFVLKPTFGLGGGGIIIIYGKDKQGRWISTGDELFTKDDLRRHISNILDGNFSMSNIPDIAYFEERLKLSEQFKHISYQGVPDIRIIVFNSVPVMAMLRLPTKQSEGKANLQIGGIGVGVDLETGTTTYATSKLLGDLDRHPDFNTPLRGVVIPEWDTILRISVEAARAIGLGYAGIDIVFDKQYGPVILEVNGHPGLEIQNANRLSLRDRLERVAGLEIESAQHGLKVSRELFRKTKPVAATSSVPLSTVGEQIILGIFETAEVTDKKQTSHTVRALVDTGLASTTITKELAIKLGFGDAMTALDNIVLPGTVAADRAQAVEESYRHAIRGLHEDVIDIVAVRSGGQYIIRPKLPLRFRLRKKLITTEVAVALDNRLSYPMIIGRRDLAGFLINPTNTV